MSYNTNIPQPSQTLAQTQPGINTNFSLINTGFAQDHVSYATGTNVGKHDKITFIQGSSGKTVTPTGTDSILFTKSVAGVPTLGYNFQATAGLIQSQIPIALHYSLALGTSTTVNLVGFNNFPAMYGTILMFDAAATTRTLFSPFVFDGTGLRVPALSGTFPAVTGQLPSGTAFKNFTYSGNILQLEKDSSSYNVKLLIQAITY